MAFRAAAAAALSSFAVPLDLPTSGGGGGIAGDGAMRLGMCGAMSDCRPKLLAVVLVFLDSDANAYPLGRKMGCKGSPAVSATVRRQQIEVAFGNEEWVSEGGWGRWVKKATIPEM